MKYQFLNGLVKFVENNEIIDEVEQKYYYMNQMFIRIHQKNQPLWKIIKI